MNPYQKAIKALENCVKDAMENDVNASTQSEIWRHYQGMKAIAKQLGRTSNYSISTSDTDTISFDYDGIVAGQPVNFPSSVGQDVITFS
jgi:hypothetical protein